MFLIWRGWGWLAFVLWVVIHIAFDSGTNYWFGVPDGEHYRDSHDWVWLLTGVLSGVACWFASKWLDRYPDSVLKLDGDNSTDEETVSIQRHALFWIPVKWWSIGFPLLGVFFVWHDHNSEKTQLIYPRTLWQMFADKHSDSGLKDLKYLGQKTILTTGIVTGIEGDALVIHIDDGKQLKPVILPDGPRLMLYPLNADEASPDRTAPDKAKWLAMQGKIGHFACSAAQTHEKADGNMHVIVLSQCRFNSGLFGMLGGG